MKKLVFASVMALASMSLVAGPTLRAQDQGGQITIKDPAEFNAYQMFSTQTDPKAKAAAGESFLEKYPQSVVKKAVLDMLLDTYQQIARSDKRDTANQLLQVDPNNMKAILYLGLDQEAGSAAKERSDAATCDDAAALAQKGLQVPKPAGDCRRRLEEADGRDLSRSSTPPSPWMMRFRRRTSRARRRNTPRNCRCIPTTRRRPRVLVDTLQLAQAYSQPGAEPGPGQGVLVLCARVGLCSAGITRRRSSPSWSITTRSTTAAWMGWMRSSSRPRHRVFPPGTFHLITPAKSPAEQIHDLIASHARPEYPGAGRQGNGSGRWAPRTTPTSSGRC